MGTEVMGTEPPGNTKRRRFQLTLNEVAKWELLLGYIEGLKAFQYGIACRELAPTTNHEHIHFYVCFNKAVRLAVSKLQGAHVEVCRGDHKSNKDYILKEGNIIYEHGEEPHQGKSLSAKQLMNMTPVEIVEADPRNHNAYLRARDHLVNGSIKLSEWSKKIDVYYITGPSGSGKSTLAGEILIELGYEDADLVSFDNGFWSGITGNCECCIFEEFRDSIMKPSEFIKFIEYRIQRINIKGGSTLNRYKTIILTSVQHPDDIYPNVEGEPRAQWLRRLKIVDLGLEDNVF